MIHIHCEKSVNICDWSILTGIDILHPALQADARLEQAFRVRTNFDALIAYIATSGLPVATVGDVI